MSEASTSRRGHASKSAPQRPSRHKLALLTWAGAYGVITVILEVLGPLMQEWPLPVRTLLLSSLMVASLTWVVMPLLARVFRGWLIASTT
jgi:antibiotic biosynthesis monooxygenase (ABM) superfamily enzyme